MADNKFDLLEGKDRLINGDMMNDVLTSKAYECVNNQFPRIGAAIKLFWGQPEFSPYVEKLLMDNRGESRKGFPGDVVIALHDLLSRHHADFPDLVQAGDALWIANQKVR